MTKENMEFLYFHSIYSYVSFNVSRLLMLHYLYNKVLKNTNTFCLLHEICYF